jgi:hypothetical protein
MVINPPISTKLTINRAKLRKNDVENPGLRRDTKYVARLNQ